MSRWDKFHNARSITTNELLRQAVVDELWADLTNWPLSVEHWHDPALRERYAPVLAHDCPRPALPVLQTGLQLARWELERDYEALDDFARNDRGAKLTGSGLEALSLEFLHRWLTDCLLEVLEVTELKRSNLIDALQQLEARLLLRPQG